ncbi:PstS family phosphate ABC transporter substrate-binding protein [Bacillus sp. FJAT-45350]|uniref:PstS family phosphate ABC transporter substrate-binding protein n=1 Tax=Bacillus sp. FJAT-45350 TaxID=2011014 RepID=UPI000BB6CB71|nr:substrate-binding domain-containing protein [Bacillus sp. FJAT-45350]
MNSTIVLKIVYSVILVALIGFFGFIGAVLTALMGGVKFYTPLVIVIAVGIAIIMILAIFKVVKPKKLMISAISFFVLCLVAIGGYELYNSYYESIEMVNDQEVDLLEYQPFHELSKVVSLEKESTLKIESDLPILDGATALYPLYSAFVKATYPEEEYRLDRSEVTATKTNQAYRNLINGDVDIIFAAGPSERQLSEAKSKGVELHVTPIGREAFVFFVNARNPVESLTIQQIQDIYSGKITNWKDVGGNNESIRAFQRPNDSGSQTALENLMGDIPLMEAPTEDVVAGMGGIIEQTSNYRNFKNAIGYSFRYYSTEMVQNGEIRHLAIEGVYPDKESIHNHEYPISAEFYAITAGSDNPNIDRFIDWILSEQGQHLVEKTGYVPVREY